MLFDLDATLLDLPVDIEPARQRVAAIFDDRGWARPLRPILLAIDEAADSVARDQADRARLIAEARGCIDDAEIPAAARATARPGAVETAAILAARGFSLGIVTDNGRACIDVALARTGLDHVPWRVVVTRDEVRRPKPDPAGVERAAVALLPDGGDLWMVGDSARDMQAACAASCAGIAIHPIGVTGGRGTAAALADAGARVAIERLGELPGLLEAYPPPLAWG